MVYDKHYIATARAANEIYKEHGVKASRIMVSVKLADEVQKEQGWGTDWHFETRDEFSGAYTNETRIIQIPNASKPPSIKEDKWIGFVVGDSVYYREVKVDGEVEISARVRISDTERTDIWINGKRFPLPDHHDTDKAVETERLLNGFFSKKDFITESLRVCGCKAIKDGTGHITEEWRTEERAEMAVTMLKEALDHYKLLKLQGGTPNAGRVTNTINTWTSRDFIYLSNEYGQVFKLKKHHAMPDSMITGWLKSHLDVKVNTAANKAKLIGEAK